nr:hypothetical protein GCM10020092_025690 [Actinoplanes digitatis]
MLDGGSGDDALVGDDPTMGTVSADVIRGGTGRDLVDYMNYTKAVVVDLDGAQRDDGQAGEHDTVGADVEGLIGGSGSDRLTGNASANEIDGWAGDDVIRGGEGDDTLSGGDDRDSLYGEAGDDDVNGGEGYQYDTPDRLDGGTNGTTGDRCDPTTTDTVVDCER